MDKAVWSVASCLWDNNHLFISGASLLLLFLPVTLLATLSWSEVVPPSPSCSILLICSSQMPWAFLHHSVCFCRRDHPAVNCNTSNWHVKGRNAAVEKKISGCLDNDSWSSNWIVSVWFVVFFKNKQTNQQSMKTCTSQHRTGRCRWHHQQNTTSPSFWNGSSWSSS